MKFAQGVKRIGHPFANDLHVACKEARVVFNGELDHAKAVSGGPHELIALERRVSRWDEKDAVKAERVGNLFGKDQVPHVYGVESPAHDAEPQRVCPSQSQTSQSFLQAPIGGVGGRL